MFSDPNSIVIRRYSGLQPYVPIWRGMQTFTDARDADTPDELWIVEQGLKPGDRVVVEGLLTVQPGVLLSVRPWSHSPATPGGNQ